MIEVIEFHSLHLHEGRRMYNVVGVVMKLYMEVKYEQVETYEVWGKSTNSMASKLWKRDVFILLFIF